ncbi:protein yippee-like [Stegodyphus dumicola]|uniref:protein yippee-like n=1 Tax=Stegodyphus dumicola TaxID=202533 RepID=UPI0015ACB21C|nr:protein yippee-like [Stegodyphus dumicola]
MGVVFLEHLGGYLIYVCDTCDAYLTNRSELLSTRFTSSTGAAYMFKNVVNTLHGNAEFREMVTGSHVVRDVFCKRCNVRIGWFYEMVSNESQYYKEGRTVLELALVSERDNFGVNSS